MTTEATWFFPARKKIEDYLEAKFGDGNYKCQFFDICHITVYEQYHVWIDDIKNTVTIQFVIHRNLPGSKNPAIIQVLYGRQEDMMQYFENENNG